MAFKQFSLDESTTVNIYKRKANRNIRLTISGSGEIRVSIPAWAPYSSGLRFARSRLDWIKAQDFNETTLYEGFAVGKAHRLKFTVDDNKTKVSSRLIGGEVVVSYPITLSSDNVEVQKVAKSACIRALRRQAEQLLPQRLADLAIEHNFKYKSVAIKLLKSRWGSCDAQKHIVLNLYLMQLPWEYIDYVLVHELVHTEVLRHGPDFWAVMGSTLPNAKQLRQQMKAYHPVLRSSQNEPVA